MGQTNGWGKFSVRLPFRFYILDNLLLYPLYVSGCYFGLAFATPRMHIERFSVLTLTRKQHQLASPNLQNNLH